MPPRQRDLDRLVQIAAAHGQLATGSPLRSVQARTDLPISVLANAVDRPGPVKALTWTEEEDDFLRRNLGWLPEDDMARLLGRTVVAIHLRWKRDLQLSASSKHPDFITTPRIAETLGVDPKAVMRWVDRGLLPGRRLPTKRVIRSVQRAAFQAWAVNPMNWIYFHPERVRDPHLKRLLELRAKRWGDAWLTVGQAAGLRGVGSTAINNAIHAGRLRGVKWGNWRLLRSEITKPGLRFHGGKCGRTVPKVEWSEPADAFLVLATALGYSPGVIAQLMGGQRSRLAWTSRRVAYRLTVLTREGRIAPLIRKFDLRVRSRRGRLSANWKDYRERFRRKAPRQTG